ncbi:hypothetical protein J6590_087844 [Homalodisca vitripennis]|nr:hypothetical protein J6590_087844 [Homalodisca vitripennis]
MVHIRGNYDLMGNKNFGVYKWGENKIQNNSTFSLFEEFVDNEMDGEVSDLDFIYDEDADPNFQPEQAIKRVQSSSDDASELELPRVVLAAQQVTQAAKTLRLVANVTPAPQVIQPAQTARDQTDQRLDRVQKRSTSLGNTKKDILDSMKFKDEYAEFLIHGDRNEDSDVDYTCVMPKPTNQPRISHPPDVLRTKNTLHLLEIPSPSSKNRCRFPGCSSNGARIRCATC